MRRTLAITLITLLGGCAVTPAEVREQGRRESLTTTLSGGALGACLERNIQDNAFVPIRRTSAQGGEEILVGSPDVGRMLTNAIIDIPAHGAASITINPAVLTPEKLRTLISKGC